MPARTQEKRQQLLNSFSVDLTERCDAELAQAMKIYSGNFQKIKCEREERLASLKKQSDIFFRFLCLHIGTERIVKLRRLLLNKCFNSMLDDGFVIGSKSEGLDMAGSDIDILLCFQKAHEKGDISSNTISDYEYDSLKDNIQPGYVMLKTKGNTAELLPSNELNNRMQAIRNNRRLKNLLKTEMHGPAVMESVNEEEYDFVPSVKSESWPNIAMEWINRKRKFGWPSQEMIHSIVQKGCNIVPVGSSRNHESDEDWRLSINSSNKENLLHVLYDIANNGWKWVLKAKTLKRYLYFMSGEKYKMEILQKETYEKEQFDIFNLVYQIVFRYRQHICFIMSRVSPVNKHLLSTMCKIPVFRQKTLPVMCHYIDTDSQNLGNKALYTLRKLHMQFLIMASTDDILCGKVLLASWLYQQGKHNECLHVTDIGLQYLDLCIFHENKRIMKTELYEKVINFMHDITDIQYLSSYELMFPFESSIIVRELAEIFGANKTEIFYQYEIPMTYYCPRNYIYFLRCLCYFKLGDAEKCEYAYTEMNSVCDRYCESFKSRHKLSNFLLKLACNKIRHNITFDFNDCFEAALVLNQHIDEFDIADNDRLDFCSNMNELLQELGLNHGAITDLVFA
ncbi:unnamed protein product [Mytilus coruscus]|uniref:Mab-21-like nucleotidyltransferase domain-containing protein n=1 Tax=Mytilus coruscus TaxID=42192 RepID=A0A6J8ASE0_MYTCO|nr:unnamed protein product [Mytilus coruscus]